MWELYSLMCIWGALALGSGQHSKGPFPNSKMLIGVWTLISGTYLHFMAPNVTVKYQQVSDDPSRI